MTGLPFFGNAKRAKHRNGREAPGARRGKRKRRACLESAEPGRRDGAIECGENCVFQNNISLGKHGWHQSSKPPRSLDMAPSTCAAPVSALRHVRWTNAPRVPCRRVRRAAAVLTRASSTAPVTKEELASAAKARGLVLETTTFGPVFKITARRVGSAGKSTNSVFDAGDNKDSDIIGEHDGFIAPPPFGILHMDSMRIYNSRINKTNDADAAMRSVFGISILLGSTSALMAWEQGCFKMELLAIDDGNEYAAKLVKYYTRLGFKFVRKVGDGANTDLTDLLVWGGAGTRMNGDLNALLTKWGGLVRKQALRAGKENKQ